MKTELTEEINKMNNTERAALNFSRIGISFAEATMTIKRFNKSFRLALTRRGKARRWKN